MGTWRPASRSLPACLAAGPRVPTSSDGEPLALSAARSGVEVEVEPRAWELDARRGQDGSVALCEEGLRPLCGGERPIPHVTPSPEESGQRLDDTVGESAKVLLEQTYF